MIAQILSIVTPVFGLVLIGYLYGRRHGPDMTGANRVNLDVFIPALIFHVLSGKEFHVGDYLDLALGVRLERADWSHWRIGLGGACFGPLPA